MKQRKTLQNLTSNEFYGGLNRRFDGRLKFLRSFGYKSNIGELGHHLIRGRLGRKPQTVSAEFIMHANNFSWREQLKTLLQRTGWFVVPSVGALPEQNIRVG